MRIVRVRMIITDLAPALSIPKDGENAWRAHSRILACGATCGKMAGKIGDIHDKYPSRENGDFPFALGEFFLRWRSFSHDARRASFLDLSRWVDGRARPDIHLRPGARRWRPIARGIALCKGPVRRLSLGSTRRPRNRRQVVSRPFGPITQSPNRRGPAGSSTSSVVLCPPS